MSINSKKAKQVFNHIKRIPWKKKILFLIICFFIFCTLYGFLVIKPLYVKAQEQVYDILADMNTGSFRRQNNTTVYDKNGELIGKIGYEHYEYVDISKISDKIQQGYIDVEDKRFKTHPGIDIKALIRATLVYIKNGFRITQGGSTITQQVIKNNLLTQERSFNRKILEILIAFQLEKEYTKADIMEFYCNSNYYGNNCYGVQGASEYYFGKDANSLDWAQAAIIVGVSNSPNRYNPIADYELCMEKKARVLNTIHNAGHMTDEEYQTALEERPEIIQRNENVGSEGYMTSYAVYCATLKLMETNGFHFKYIFDSQEEYESYRDEFGTSYNDTMSDIRDGGYHLETSFDRNIQSLLQTSVDEALKGELYKQEDGRYDTQGAAVCIDNQSGLVVAVVGGRGTEESFNRGYQAKRQAGSVIKPLLVYGPALNEGIIIPSTIYEDREIDINGYHPKNGNDEYLGEITIREALARSVNTVASQVFYNVGAGTALSYLGDLRFSSLCFGDSYNMAVSLGGFTRGVTVCDVARGYATIANSGYMNDGGCIRKIISEREGTVYEYDLSKAVEVYTPDTAFMLQDMMQGVFKEEFGTAYEYNTDEQNYAGKTGTTNDGRDAWFSGFSPYYTCTVWVGSDTSRVIDGLTGSGYPLQIWDNFMRNLHSDIGKEDFPVPDTVFLTDGETTREIDYYTDIYNNRPDGWDYMSSLLDIITNEKERKQNIDAEVQNAEEAVNAFESYRITNMEEAQGLNAYYQETLDIISSIEDNEKQADLKERAEIKYAGLSGEVAENWIDASEAEKLARQAEQDIENGEAAAESSEIALQITHDNRVYTVELYIEYLNNRSVYVDGIESMITDAEEALSKCTSYEEYDDLRNKLSASVARVRELPKEETVLNDSDKAQSDVSKAQKDTNENNDFQEKLEITYDES